MGLSEDAAKSYAQKAFSNVYSEINKQPLSKATKSAVHNLLIIITQELLESGESQDVIKGLLPNVKVFIEDELICSCIEPLFLDPNYQLDPKTLASAWDKPEMPSLSKNFSWSRIANEFTNSIKAILISNEELKATFESLQRRIDSDRIREFAGLPAGFDLDRYREALRKKYESVSFDSIDAYAAIYDGISLQDVFVPQLARECHKYVFQHHELPKEFQEVLVKEGHVDKNRLQALEVEQESLLREYYEKPTRLIQEITSDPSIPLCVILGDPGSGKSTLLRSIALQWARIEDDSDRMSQPLPLLIGC